MDKLTSSNTHVSRQRSALRIAANRRNALKSTGPKTIAGKRRVAMNGVSHNLCPQELAQQLIARGEDPREFCRLQRDLIAIFQARDQAELAVVELLARVWWEKARRIRGWVPAGPAPSEDLDARLEELVRLLVQLLRTRHEWWQHRLLLVLGRPIGSPADVRRRIESRLFIFGGVPGRRKYQQESLREQRHREFEEMLGRVLAEELGRAPEKPQTASQRGDKAKQTQMS